LKNGEWNKVRLTLKGDTVTLRLNDVDVYQRDLEATNQRVFGLYHDAARSEARVRNVVYRGEWPKALPPLAEQELAVSPASRATFASKPLPARFEFDFRGTKPLPADLLPVPGDGEKKYIRRTAGGAKIVLPVDQDKPNSVGYETGFALRGDFEFVVVYSGLKTSPGPKAWGPGIDLQLRLDAPDNPDIMFERRQRDDGGHVLQALRQYDLPGKLDRISTIAGDPISATAGKLKIVRRGPMIYYLFAEHDSDDYRLLFEYLVGQADALRALVSARTFGKESGVEVVLEGLSVRAEKFLPSK
jgi:hypothetical protein